MWTITSEGKMIGIAGFIMVNALQRRYYMWLHLNGTPSLSVLKRLFRVWAKASVAMNEIYAYVLTDEAERFAKFFGFVAVKQEGPKTMMRWRNDRT